MTWIRKAALTFPLILILSSLYSIAAASHFQWSFSPTDYGDSACDWIGKVKIMGVDAQPGDEVAFFNAAGENAGWKSISAAGQYGILHVYGYHLNNGDVVTVRIWDATRAKEWRSECIHIEQGAAQGEFFIPSAIPPAWENRAGFVLDIRVDIPPGDINGDCAVDLADAVMGLKVISAGAQAEAVQKSADISGSERIGLDDVIFILQKVAGVR